MWLKSLSTKFTWYGPAKAGYLRSRNGGDYPSLSSVWDRGTTACELADKEDA